MTGTNQSTTGSSSAFSGFDDVKTNTPAIQVGNAVRDGDEFVLIVQSRQSQKPQIWASGDNEQMQQLVRSTYNELSSNKLSETTRASDTLSTSSNPKSYQPS